MANLLRWSFGLSLPKKKEENNVLATPATSLIKSLRTMNPATNNSNQANTAQAAGNNAFSRFQQINDQIRQQAEQRRQQEEQERQRRIAEQQRQQEERRQQEQARRQAEQQQQEQRQRNLLNSAGLGNSGFGAADLRANLEARKQAIAKRQQETITNKEQQQQEEAEKQRQLNENETNRLINTYTKRLERNREILNRFRAGEKLPGQLNAFGDYTELGLTNNFGKEAPLKVKTGLPLTEKQLENRAKEDEKTLEMVKKGAKPITLAHGLRVVGDELSQAAGNAIFGEATEDENALKKIARTIVNVPLSMIGSPLGIPDLIGNAVNPYETRNEIQKNSDGTASINTKKNTALTRIGSGADAALRLWDSLSGGEKEIITSLAGKGAKASLLNTLKNMGKTALEEGVQESAENLAEELADQGKWDEGTIGRTVESGLLGAATGGAMSGISSGINGIRQRIANKVNSNVNVNEDINTNTNINEETNIDPARVQTTQDGTMVKTNVDGTATKLSDAELTNVIEQKSTLPTVSGTNPFINNSINLNSSEDLNTLAKRAEQGDTYAQQRLTELTGQNQENTGWRGKSVEEVINQGPQSLVESAKQYGINDSDGKIQDIQNMLGRQNITARYDADAFRDSNENAMWRIYQDENGNIVREVVFNPNAKGDAIVQELAVHELSHDIFAKNTKTSEQLYKNVKQWLENDPEYQQQLNDLKNTYGDIDVEEEAIAKTLQSKFGNQEEINRLVNYEPTVARKIYDWVVDKLNKVTGGRIEKLYWTDIKNKFERAYSESGDYATNEETMFAKKTTNDGTRYVELDGKLFRNEDGTQKTPRKAYEALVGKILTLDDGSEVKIVKKLPGDKDLYNELIRRRPRSKNVNDIKGINNKINGNIDEVLEQSDFVNNKEDVNNRHSANQIKSFDTREARIYDGDQAYRLTLSIAELNNGDKIGYAKKFITPDEGLTRKIKKEAPLSSTTNKVGWSSRSMPLSDNIPQDTNNVNTKMSITPTTDSNGKTLSKQQQEYFKDSKVRDEDGNLKEVYHGSYNGNFYTFNKDFANPEGDWGKGFYATDNEYDVKDNYEGGGPDFDNKVSRLAEQIEQDEDISYEEAEEKARKQLDKGAYLITAYADIKNPAIVGETNLFDGSEYDVKSMEDYDNIDDYYNDLIYDISDDVIADTNIDYRYKDDLMRVMSEAWYDGGMSMQDLKNKIGELDIEDYDGNLVSNEVARSIIENLGFDGIIDNTVSNKFNMNIPSGTTHYIVFDSKQFKNVDNTNPTTNPDIRYDKTSDFDDYVNKRTGQEDAEAEELRNALGELYGPMEEKTQVAPSYDEDLSVKKIEDVVEGKTSFNDYIGDQRELLWKSFKDSNRGGVESFLVQDSGSNDYQRRVTTTENGTLYRQLYQEYGGKPTKAEFNEALEDVLINGKDSKYYRGFREFDHDGETSAFGYNKGNENIDLILDLKDEVAAQQKSRLSGESSAINATGSVRALSRSGEIGNSNIPQTAENVNQNTDVLPEDFDVKHYVTDQTEAQKKRSKVPLRERIADTTAELKHYLVDDAVAYERYIKDKNERLNIREGVDRVRSSDMIARQYMIDNKLGEVVNMPEADLNEFQQYLIAKRALEVAEQGKATGRSKAADQALIDAVGDKYAKQEQIIRDYTRGMLKYSADNGLISQKLKDDLIKNNPNYVPMNRVFDVLEKKTGFKSKQLGNLSNQSVVQKMTGSERVVENPIESLMANTLRMVNEVERNNTAKLIAKSNAFHEKTLAEGEKPRPGYDALNYMVDGKKVSYEVPELVAKEMKNLNNVLPKAAENILKVAGAPTRWLRSGATQNNPIFAVSNLLRDQMQTVVTGKVSSNLKGTKDALVATFSPTKRGKDLRAELNRAGIIGSEYRQTYGYKSGDLMAQLQADNKLSKGVKNKLKHPIDAIGDLIGRTEYFTRAQQYFGTDGDATTKAQAARNNTLNFNRAGSATRILNRIIPFLNAGVQGGRITVNSFKNRPVHTTLAIASLAGIALAAKGAAEAQDKELWDRIDESDKGQNIIIFTPNAHYDGNTNRVEGIIKIPVAQMLYPVMDATNNLKGDPSDLTMLAGDIFTATTGIEAPTEEKGFLPVVNQLTPTAVKPFLEASMNKSTYTGNEIVSEYDSNKNPEDKGAKYTTGLARTIAKATGVDAPVVDNFIQNWGGGLAKDLSKVMTDNPDNKSDGGGIGKMFENGFNRRFLSGTVESQYEIAEGLAKNYKKEVKNSEAFKSLSSEDQQKVLNAIDNDMKGIASVSTKVEQGKTNDKTSLTKRQTEIVANGFNSDSYINAVTDKKATYSGSGQNGAGQTLNGNVLDYGKTAVRNNPVEISDSISGDSKSILSKYNSMKSDDWNKYIYGTSEDSAAAEYKLALAKYENDLANGKINDAQKVKKEKELAKLAVSQKWTKDYRDAYSLAGTKADMQAYLNGLDAETRKQTVSTLNGLNNAMYEAGIISASTYKTRYNAINNTTSKKSGGRKRSSGKSSKSEGISSAEASALASLAKTMTKGDDGVKIKTPEAPETKRKMSKTKSSGNKTGLATYTPSSKKSISVSRGAKRSIA